MQELCQQEICPRKCGIPIVDELRDKIVQKAGLYGFRSLDIIFKKFDLNNDKTLSKKELDAGMRELGIEPTQFELVCMPVYVRAHVCMQVCVCGCVRLRVVVRSLRNTGTDTGRH